jgi:hypothetical protein
MRDVETIDSGLAKRGKLSAAVPPTGRTLHIGEQKRHDP